MIFIAMAAYGVVSRAMILYKQVPFTGSGIFSHIFYEPYWFMYGEVSDKALLDGVYLFFLFENHLLARHDIEMIGNSTVGSEAEAVATHVLLAFHMLFINVLLLNLLVAVFA